ncbi:MAG: SDR family oxidoreductase [Deinococcota bacterium]
MSLAGKVAVVTGATGGIGAAICSHLAGAGASVVVTYRSDVRAAEELKALLEGDSHSTTELNLAEVASIQNLAEHVRDTYERLDILVNNAGMTRFVAHDDLDNLTDELIDTIFQTNWRGAFAMIRALHPFLKASGEGVIVNISSIAGRTGNGSNVAYCASKAAMDSMTRSLGRALAPAVRVVSVAPGLVAGKYTDKLDPAWNEAQRQSTPLKRLATADDVARAVVAVARDLTFSTGCILPVDGGRPLT